MREQMPRGTMTSIHSEVAVYDLDRTLTDTGSWTPFIRFWLAREAPWRVLLLPMVALGGVAYGLGWLSRGQIALAPARAAIATDAMAGRRVVIASASHAYYVRAIAACFGVADVVATEAVRVGSDVTPALDGANCYGPAKRAALERWLAHEGLAGAVVHFTSDHHSDAPCFELALETGGSVLCANPSAKLAALAAQRGWPVALWGRIRGSLLERA
ncbi:MAG: hypothetical protein B7Z50_03890 [Sphingomonadales bacterium 12-62-5]|nr:MAG: hypothetical protein B7Z50_03890 [Sphingomonadales bacterium 12-62-5]